jgi:hypothetical protein
VPLPRRRHYSNTIKFQTIKNTNNINIAFLKIKSKENIWSDGEGTVG